MIRRSNRLVAVVLWFDPAEVTGQFTPFWMLYALHDALVKLYLV